MNELEKLMESEPNAEVKRELKYAIYVYKDLLTDSNKELLDDYTNTLIRIFKKKGIEFEKINFSNKIMEGFYLYLIKTGKTEKTAYDYVKRLERICKEYNITEEDLFNRKSEYSIEDLIGMYSSTGVKGKENKDKHNAPLSSLKQFRNYMNEQAENCYEPRNASFYLCEVEDYQSFEIVSKHPCRIEIDGKHCEITFKENRIIVDEVEKIISDENYNSLLKVFKKYKNILTNSTVPSFVEFPYGGSHSYRYQFEDKSNYSGCSKLFESDNKKIEDQACIEYREIIEKIINQ